MDSEDIEPGWDVTLTLTLVKTELSRDHGEYYLCSQERPCVALSIILHQHDSLTSLQSQLGRN